ncbi:unnamed protein product, partial [Iphiclides podalirius]
MSLSCYVMSISSRFLPALPFLLVLWVMGSDASPLFGFLDAFDTTSALNGTSILGALALAHIEHSIAKVNALAQLAGLFANFTETAIVGG